METLNVRRMQAVVWMSDELMADSKDGGRTEATAAMRGKVYALADAEAEGRVVRLVSIDAIEPGDPEFQHQVEVAGLDPVGMTPWVGVWEVAQRQE